MSFDVHVVLVADQARDLCWRDTRIRALEGPPGSGKTTVACALVDEVLAQGLEVLWTVFTAQLASRMRERLPKGVVVDTCHAALGLEADPTECALCLTPYSLVIVDEFGQLEGKHLAHLVALHMAADRVPAIGLLGDRWQMPGFGEARPWHTHHWHAVHCTSLHDIYRCKDPEFRKQLNCLRTSKPTVTKRHGSVCLSDLCRGRKAWKGHAPNKQDIASILRNHPNTTFMTITRAGATLINDLAVKALYGKAKSLIILPGDVESNPDNYHEDGTLKSGNECVPLPVPCHAGMKLLLTKNVDKDRDYVNGMEVEIETFDAHIQALVVLSRTGHRLAIRPWTDPNLKISFFPMKPGYASTILKMAGAELDHAVVWLDKAHVPGAAYTGMSRVSYGKNLLLGGLLSVDHFTPVQG